jgi:hypothetical protein
MDDTPGRVTHEDAADESGTVDRRTREIRHEIEETRVEMAETIDALQEKLRPRNIVANATDRVKNAAGERVRAMTDTASQTAQQAMDYTRDITSGITNQIRRNPIPLALIGLGAAWLLASRWSNGRRWNGSRRDQFDETEYGSEWARDERLYREQNQYGVRSRTKEYASDAADSMRRMVRRRQNQLQHMVQDNPLLVGAGAMMLGAAFGLAVPETDTENQWMGDARDTVVERAREMAHDAASRVQDAAGTVADTAGKVAQKSQP